MAITPRRLVSATLTNATATYYTAGSGIKARIDAPSLMNYSGSAATFSLWLVPTGGAADNTNILIKDRSVAAGASGRILEAVGQWLDAGGSIQMSASANTAITVTFSGIEQTGI